MKVLIIATFATLFSLSLAVRLRANLRVKPTDPPPPPSDTTPRPGFIVDHDDSIVYIKSLKSGYGGRYLSYHNVNGVKRAKFREEYESLVIGNADMRWKLKMYESIYFTLENQGKPGYFLKAQDDDEPVRIVDNTYPQGSDKFLWKTNGLQSQITSFQLINKKYFPKKMFVQGDHDLEFTNDDTKDITYQLWEPVISEFTDVITTIDNPDNAQYTYQITYTVGISHSQTFSITTSIETEVSTAIVKASIKGSISTSWSQTSTYYASTTQTHSVTIGQGRWEFRQLKATYGSLTVGQSSYGIYLIHDYSQ